MSTVPTQALTLLNNDFVLSTGALLRDRVAEAAPGDPATQVDLAYRIALSRPPTAEESALAAGVPAQAARWIDFTHVLLNLNEFLYIR